MNLSFLWKKRGFAALLPEKSRIVKLLMMIELAILNDYFWTEPRPARHCQQIIQPSLPDLAPN